MPGTVEEHVEAAELAVFARKELSLGAAAEAGLIGRFESFRMGGLRASIATGVHYGFLNTTEGVTDQSAEALSDVLSRFPDPWQPAIIATFPSPNLVEWLLDEGYEPAPEHALPAIRGFIASRNDRPLAAAAMSLHDGGAVLGGAATLPAARGTGAQTAPIAHRLRLAKDMGMPLSTATASPGTPSLRNLAKIGPTVVERTAWRYS